MIDKPLLIIDSNFIAHAAKHSFKEMDYMEMKTGIIFGFLRRVVQLGKQFSTNRFVFSWDSRKSYRKEISPIYKAHRHDGTEEEKEINNLAFEQFNLLRVDILPSLGFPHVVVATGYESDDLIASIVMNTKGMEKVVVSVDKDLYQLLDHCRMYNPTSKTLVDGEWFRKEYSISPEQWVDVKAIAGCSGDNVVGLKGVGEKTVIKYLHNKLKGKTYEAIVSDDGKRVASENRRLVELPFENVPVLSYDEHQFDYKLNREKFIEMCVTFGFQSFLNSDSLDKWGNIFGWENGR